MRIVSRITKRSTFAAVAFGYALLLTVGVLSHAVHANAAGVLATRSLQISSSKVSAAGTSYTFGFSLSGAGTTAQSLEFDFCLAPLVDAACAEPGGMAVAGATVSGSTGVTGWTLGTAGDGVTMNTGIQPGGGTGGQIRATRTSATTYGSATPMTITFGGITNSNTANQTFFVRITAFTDAAYTTIRDQGTVASAITQQITITAKVQEALNFSVGSVSTTDTGNCTPYSDSGALTIGDPNNGLSSSQAYGGHSYFRISTNAVNGTKVYYSGDTLKSGTNSITSVGETPTGTASAPGTSQFGLGIDETDTATNFHFASLSAVTSPNDYSKGNGTISSGKYQFNTSSLTSPIAIATTNSVITCDTGSVQYIANIATNTPPGVYTTAINYIAVPTY